MQPDKLAKMASEMGFQLVPVEISNVEIIAQQNNRPSTTLMVKLLNMSLDTIESLKTCISWDLASRSAKIECLGAVKSHLIGLNRLLFYFILFNLKNLNYFLLNSNIY